MRSDFKMESTVEKGKYGQLRIIQAVAILIL